MRKHVVMRPQMRPAVCGLWFAVSAKQLAALDAHHRGFGGALGDGDPWSDKMTPTVLWGGLAFTRIAAGYLHTCGLLVDGTAICWCACSPGAWAGLGYVCCMQWGQGGCVGPTECMVCRAARGVHQR